MNADNEAVAWQVRHTKPDGSWGIWNPCSEETYNCWANSEAFSVEVRALYSLPASPSEAVFRTDIQRAIEIAKVFDDGGDGADPESSRGVVSILQSILDRAASPSTESQTELPAYDAGILNNFGGGDVEWWQDYIRGELGRAHEHYCSHFQATPASPSAEPQAELTTTFVQTVPDKCDRIVWRNHYYSLPASPSAAVVREDSDPLALALRFHDEYERLAPQFGYETRTETRQFDPESPNGRLMVAVCAALMTQGATP